MDGTIIHTKHVWEKANQQLLENRSIDLSQQELESIQLEIHGLSTSDCCIFLKEKFDIQDSVEKLVQEKSSHALDLLAKEVNYIEGFESFIEEHINKKMKVGLATNASPSMVSITNKVLNLSKYFGHHLYDISHVGNIGKPNPAIFLHAAQQLETSPNECVVIEDSFHGVLAAKKAGMYCIGINTAKKPELLFNADKIVDSYLEIDLAGIEKK